MFSQEGTLQRQCHMEVRTQENRSPMWGGGGATLAKGWGMLGIWRLTGKRERRRRKEKRREGE